MEVMILQDYYVCALFSIQYQMSWTIEERLSEG
jgi:hypothetical protein